MRCECLVVAGVCLFAFAVAQADILELEGTVKSIDAAKREITIIRKTPKGEKVLELEVAKNAGDLSSVKVGDNISFSFDADLELVTKIEQGGDIGVQVAFDSSAFFKDLQSLQGVWLTTTSVVGGRQVDAHTLTTQRHMLEVAGTTMVFHASLPTREVRNKRVFVLDPASKTITLWWRESDGKLNQGIGIYSLEGDDLKICYVYNQDGTAKRPNEFVSVPGPPPNAFHTYRRSR